ncbi:UBA-like domain-containing protein 2 [Toxocara canis]|uniref:UBA-like domain-containing protein 2 n=1 Tax=Toxocara canis TaxID=6265 RepID=A0A0B2W1H4_TOXCA|nr:UBA-like domain-containing protein 2 [Toxocara canis]
MHSIAYESIELIVSIKLYDFKRLRILSKFTVSFRRPNPKSPCHQITTQNTVREVLLIGQLAHATGCSPEEAHRLLSEHRWQLEAAISAWFMPAPHLPIVGCCGGYMPQNEPASQQQPSPQHHQALCPCNTPATPPSVNDAIHEFQKMEWRCNFFEEYATLVREVLLIGQLAHATGCSPEEAHRLLSEHRWQLEAAISAWFMPAPHLPIVGCCGGYMPQNEPASQQQPSPQHHQALCPCNTPATPPSVNDAIHEFQKMEWRCNFFEDKVLSDDRENNCFCSPPEANTLS